MERASPEPDFPIRSVNDGLRTLGRIYADGLRFRAVDDNDRWLGTFASLKDARAAIIDAEAERFLKRAARRRAA